MPVDYRQALTGFQRFFTERTSEPPVADAVSFLPRLTIPIGRAFDQVQPGVFTSAALAATAHKFTWPIVPPDESHVYENISFRSDGVLGVDVVLAVQGNQAGTSWSRVYAEIDGVRQNERINLLARSRDVGGGGSPTWYSGGPLRVYSGEQVVVRILTNVSLNSTVRFDWLRRIRESPFTFRIENDVVVVT